MSYLDQVELQAQYEAAMFSMAHQVDYGTMILLMQYFADNDEFGAAEGVRLAIADHRWNVGKQHCRATGLDITFEPEEEEGYNDGYDED